MAQPTAAETKREKIFSLIHDKILAENARFAAVSVVDLNPSMVSPSEFLDLFTLNATYGIQSDAAVIVVTVYGHIIPSAEDNYNGAMMALICVLKCTVTYTYKATDVSVSIFEYTAQCRKNPGSKCKIIGSNWYVMELDEGKKLKFSVAETETKQLAGEPPMTDESVDMRFLPTSVTVSAAAPAAGDGPDRTLDKSAAPAEDDNSPSSAPVPPAAAPPAAESEPEDLSFVDARDHEEPSIGSTIPARINPLVNKSATTGPAIVVSNPSRYLTSVISSATAGPAAASARGPTADPVLQITSSQPSSSVTAGPAAAASISLQLEPLQTRETSFSKFDLTEFDIEFMDEWSQTTGFAELLVSGKIENMTTEAGHDVVEYARKMWADLKSGSGKLDTFIKLFRVDPFKHYIQ